MEGRELTAEDDDDDDDNEECEFITNEVRMEEIERMRKEEPKQWR